jgi:hypothetical protein
VCQVCAELKEEQVRRGTAEKEVAEGRLGSGWRESTSSSQARCARERCLDVLKLTEELQGSCQFAFEGERIEEKGNERTSFSLPFHPLSDVSSLPLHSHLILSAFPVLSRRSSSSSPLLDKSRRVQQRRRWVESEGIDGLYQGGLTSSFARQRLL